MEMDITEFAAVPAITAIVYIAAYFIKTVSASGKANSMLPPVCGIMGLILGLVYTFTSSLRLIVCAYCIRLKLKSH